MGNVIGIQFSCDAILTRCLNCIVNKAAYIRQLEDKLTALQTELQKLIEVRNDVLRRVMVAEQRQMKRTDQVAGWLSRVQALEIEIAELMGDGSQEIEKLCLGGYCSKNCNSSYRFGKKVVVKLQLVETLMGEKDFEVVAAEAAESVADERPTEPVVVGLQSTLERVWKCLVEEPSAGIIGLYGMGGVGKTTLLTQINNEFLESPSSFDCVIWVVVSKDMQLERIQDIIGTKIGLFDYSWKDRKREEKALDIFRILSKKKFVLLLDDVWERVDLTKVGVPLAGPKNSASKVVFTTRSEEVCGFMEARKKFKVACLSDNDAWELFQQKVGQETLDSHPDIPELAQKVTNECGGLPLALITIGRAMACKKTPGEWKYAIHVLRTTASEFPGLGKEVYPLLKFSYDNLPNDTARSCLLYCSLYSEDYRIPKEDLIDCWIAEGFLDESVAFGLQNQGYHILGILLHACLLEEVADDEVKMHDVIRDMALWIACDIEKEKEKFLVYAGAGLSKLPDRRGWENVRRFSLMQNEIEELIEIPTCPHLLTLFLNDNLLWLLSSGFFQFMPSLKVLNLSHTELELLPFGISMLESLQYLNLSNTSITALPREFKAMVNLKCLNLENTSRLTTIPQQLISNLSRLNVLRMFGAGHSVLAEELFGLKHLEVLSFTLTSSEALQSFLSSQKLRSCTQALLLKFFQNSISLDVSGLEDLKLLNRLLITGCDTLEELKIGGYTGEVQHFGFQSLQRVQIALCCKLKDLTFLAFAPNLKSMEVSNCDAMETIIGADVPEVMGNQNPFAKLQFLRLVNLPNLKIIYWEPLPFIRLKEMIVDNCHELKKLPLDSSTEREHKFVIRGKANWWRVLRWEDEATKNIFLPCFQHLAT